MIVYITVDLEVEGTIRKIISNPELQTALCTIGDALWKENIQSQVIFHLPTGNVVYNPIKLEFTPEAEAKPPKPMPRGEKMNERKSISLPFRADLMMTPFKLATTNVRLQSTNN